jgi:carnitine O-acetyltransferase
MLDNNVNENERCQALVKAISAHNNYAKMACIGQGVDRHLLGLQLIAQEQGLEVPNFFDDPAWKVSTRHRISSSQVSGLAEACVGFGPLVMDGYGCCYNIREHDLMFGLSCMKSCNETSVTAFKDAMEQSMLEMHDLLASRKGQSKL